MVCFTIALRSSQTTSNWDSVVADFNATLRSIFNQTDPNFAVFVTCSEIPPLFEAYDDRLKFLCVDFPVPTKWIEYCRDRAMKLMAATMEIRKNFDIYAEEDGGVFIFPVDADDLISKNVVKFVNDHPSANGFKSAKGFVWKRGERILTLSPYYGGSCNILKLYRDELADHLPPTERFFDEDMGRYLIQNYKICWDDHEVEQRFSDLGRAFTRIPFPSTIYCLGTGENISEIDPRISKEPSGRFYQMTGINFHPVALLRKLDPRTTCFLTKKRKREFALQ